MYCTKAILIASLDRRDADYFALTLALPRNGTPIVKSLYMSFSIHGGAKRDDIHMTSKLISALPSIASHQSIETVISALMAVLLKSARLSHHGNIRLRNNDNIFLFHAMTEHEIYHKLRPENTDIY